MHTVAQERVDYQAKKRRTKSRRPSRGPFRLAGASVKLLVYEAVSS